MNYPDTLEQEGLYHFKNFFEEKDIEPIERDIFDVACGLLSSRGGGLLPEFQPGEVDRALVRLVSEFTNLQGPMYDRLQQMPSLLAVPGQPKILEIASKALKTDRLGVWPRTQLRMDMPNDAANTIRWHNDYIYNGGTTASLTFWFPLLDISDEMGPLLFAPRSHTLNLKPIRTGGPEKFDYDLSKETLEKLEIIKPAVRRRDLVVFHGLLWHAGQLNKTKDRARLSGLFRLQDLNKIEMRS